MLRLALLLSCAAACSSGPQGGRPSGPPVGSETPPGASEEEAPDERLTREDCVAILDHFLEVMLAEKRASGPPEEVPTEQQVAEIKSRMQDQIDTCVGDSRRPYDCVMAARSTDAINACLEGE